MVRLVEWPHIDLASRYRLHDAVIKDTEEQFTEDRCSRGTIAHTEKFFGSSLIRNAYKKTYALNVYEAYKLRLIVGYIIRTNPHLERLTVNPEETVIECGDLKALLAEESGTCRITIPLLTRMKGFFIHAGKKVWTLAKLGAFPFWVMIKTGIPARDPLKKQSFTAGIRIYRTDFSFFQKYRSIDFLVDGKTLTKDNTLFTIETDISPQYQQDLHKREYHCVDMRQILHHADRGFYRKTFAGKYIPLWFRLFLSSLSESPAATMMSLEALHSGLIWTLFCRYYHCDQYVAYNDTIPKHIVRNRILEENGTGTCFYVFSCNTTNYFTPNGEKEYIHLYFSYLTYDTLISWGDKITANYKSHPNSLRSIVSTGCIWSEPVVEIRNNPSGNGCLIRAREEITRKHGSFPGKVVAVFDTTFDGDSPLNSDDILAFLTGIYRLLESSPGCAVIFKMKNPWGYHITLSDEIKGWYSKIADHPRCLMLNGFDIEAAEVVAAADLTISACFTSPTIEAWGAGLPGVYFDATARFIDHYYDRLPHFTAHSYDELEALAEFWLSGAGDLERREYIRTWIVPDVDTFADGKGLTRFRQFATGKNPGQKRS